MKTIKTILISLIVFGFIFATKIAFAAWVGPSANPPGSNTEPPINTSAVTQYKGGAFGLNGLFTADLDRNGASGSYTPFDYMQITASGFSDPDKGVTIGFDTLNNVGHIYSREVGAGSKPLAINGNSFFSAGLNGSVGIGNTSPTQKLDVTGNVKATQFCLGGSCISSWPVAGGGSNQWTDLGSDIYRATGNVGIGMSAPVSVLNVKVPNWTNQDVQSEHVIIGSGTSNGNGLRFGYNSSSNTGIINTLQPNVAWGKLILQNGGGNVGIGTTNPGQKLSVAGTIESTSGGIKFPDGTIQATASIGGIGGSGTIGKIPKFTAGATFGDSALTEGATVLSTTKGLGVSGYFNANSVSTLGGLRIEPGLSSPDYSYIRFGDNTGWKLYFGRLQESNGGSINTGSTGVILTLKDIGNVGVGTIDPLLKLTIGDSDTGIDWISDGVLAVKTNNVERIRINASGNVGIGNTSPTQKLDVTGNVKATQFCLGGSCISSWPVGGSSQWTTTGGDIYYNTGNVGIKTSSPSIDLSIGDSDTGFDWASDGNFAIYTNNVERVRFDSSGRVGIGTNSPTVPLQIGTHFSSGLTNGKLFINAGANNAWAGKMMISPDGNLSVGGVFGINFKNTSGSESIKLGLGTLGYGGVEQTLVLEKGNVTITSPGYLKGGGYKASTGSSVSLDRNAVTALCSDPEGCTIRLIWKGYDTSGVLRALTERIELVYTNAGAFGWEATIINPVSKVVEYRKGTDGGGANAAIGIIQIPTTSTSACSISDGGASLGDWNLNSLGGGHLCYVQIDD